MSMWRKARKRSVVVEYREPLRQCEVIRTPEGTMVAVIGRDYVIRGVKGELYPIKTTIFRETYTPLISRGYPWEDKPCQLCDSTGDTLFYCGGPVTYICPRCRDIVEKYTVFQGRREKWWQLVLLERKQVNFGIWINRQEETI